MAAQEATFRAKVVNGFLWLSVGTFVGQLIGWASTIIVIRLLLPKDYGLMAMASSVISILTTFSELGVGASIVQSERMAEKEIRQINGFVIASSAAGWLLCHMAAPLAALFYHEPDLVLILRVMNINLLLIALYIVPQALFIREMNFRSKATIEVSAHIVSALLTLVLALFGWGVWSLIIGTISLNAIKAIVFNLARAVRYLPQFDYRGAEQHITYGATLTGSRLLYSLYNISDTIIIGKFLGQYALGLYAVALNLASIPAEKVLPLVNQISFSSYARIQDDRERIRRNLLRTTRLIAFSGFPIFWGMAAVAQEAIPIILGAKWASAVLPFQLLCIVLPLKALGPVLASTLNAIGEARISLTNTVFAGVVMVVAFLIGVQEGIMGVCLAWIVAFPVVFLVTTVRSVRVLGIAVRRYLSEITFPFFASATMIGVVFLARTIITPSPLYSLMLFMAIGMLCYLTMTLLFRKNEFMEMKALLHR